MKKKLNKDIINVNIEILYNNSKNAGAFGRKLMSAMTEIHAAFVNFREEN
ncbi:MAG: hypothetical protein QXH07_05110 [Thermoplasmata archaeon]